MRQHLLILLTGLLAGAAGLDIFSRRIPNAVVVSVAASGLLARALYEGALSAGIGLIVALAIGAALVLPWRVRLLGGGDLKLIAATAIWFAPSQLGWFLFRVALAGGLVAGVVHLMATIERRRSPVPATAAAETPPSRTLTIPYGVAVALGGILTAWSGG